MKRIATVGLLLVLVMVLGCGAVARTIDYGSMKTDVKMSESIFLTPTDAPKTIYIQIRNTCSNQGLTSPLQNILLGGLQSKGYQIVQKPSEAVYIFQNNIRYAGEWQQGMNFEGTLTGAGLGALAGLSMSSYHHYGSGAVAGGLVGAGIGFVADIATRVKTAVIVIEFRITERLIGDEDITGQRVEKNETSFEMKSEGALGTMRDFPTARTTSKRVTSGKEGVKIYDAAVAARAAQVNLNIEEASTRLIEVAGYQILGIF